MFALAAYVAASAGWKLWTHQGAEFSLPGFIISVLAIPIMYLLSRRKLQVANALGGRALRTDAIESITCGWLAFVVVGALAAQFILGAWWVDVIASLGIVWFLVREGRDPQPASAANPWLVTLLAFSANALRWQSARTPQSSHGAQNFEQGLKFVSTVAPTR